MRAALVSVDYSDLLFHTLPWNRHHFEDVLVVTTPGSRDGEIAKDNDCKVYYTDAFYRNGATFNKWLALELGLTAFGFREPGWLCLMDADVLWPRDLRVYDGDSGSLYFGYPAGVWRLAQWQLCSPLRHMYETIQEFAHLPIGQPGLASGVATKLHLRPFPPEDRWREYPTHRNVAEWAGYTQVFHTTDPVLGPAPWHQLDWRHAGGADSFFQMKWAPENKVRPTWNVLHIGAAGQNWMGRASKYLDGSTPKESDEKLEKVRQIWLNRKGKSGDGRFEGEKL